MRIAKLSLQNFRNHKDTTLELGDATFVCVRGSNFSGKSSIAQAISMALTPSTSGLDPQGRGFAVKIRRGEEKATVTALIKGKQHLLQRTVTLHGSAAGRTQETVCIDEPDWKPTSFDKLLDQGKASLGVAFNTNTFLYAMEEKDQKNLMARLALPGRYDFPRETIIEVEKFLGPRDPINFDGDPVAAINTAYKRLYDERTILNRQVKDFTIPEPVQVPAGVDSNALQNKLVEAREKRAKVSADRDKAIRKASDAEIKRARIAGTIDATKARITDAEAVEKSSRLGILPAETLADAQRLADLKPKYDSLTLAMHDASAAIRELNSTIDLCTNLANTDGVCPTCDQKMSAESLKQTEEVARKTLSEAGETLRQLRDERDALGDIDFALRSIAAHQKAIVDTQSAKDAVSLLRTLLAKEEEKLAAEPKPDKTAEFDQALAALDTEIASITTQLRPVIAAEERAKEIATRKEKLAVLQASAASIDKLVKYFDKDGIKAKLLAQYVGGFERKINEVMQAWGYECSLAIEPYRFMVTNAQGITSPVQELSGAEELMFSLALQCAVSRAAGIGIVVADRMDTFWPPEREKAYEKLLLMIEDGLIEQVFVIETQTSEEVPDIPHSAFFMVENGAARKMEVLVSA